MDTHLNEELLARRLKMSPRTLQGWRQAGRGPRYLKLGGRVVYRLIDIEAWEQERGRTGTSSTPEI